MLGATANLGTATGYVKLDSSGFDAGAKKVKRDLDTLKRDLTQSMSSLGRSLSIGLTAPLVALGAAAVATSTRMDSLKRGLTAVAGSSQEAERQLKRLKEVAKLPGLGFEEAIQGSIRLQAAGLSAATAERSLRGFGNAIATVGGSKADLDGVTRALGQIAAKGQVFAEEINQINERVPQIRQAMKAAFGTATTEELQKMGLTAQQFLDGVNAQFEKMPQVVGGAQNSFDNFTDSAKRGLTAIGDLVLPGVTALLDKLAPAIEEVAERFKALPSPIQTALGGLAVGGAVIGPALIGLSSLITSIGNIKTALTALSTSGALTTLIRIGTAAGAIAAVIGLAHLSAEFQAAGMPQPGASERMNFAPSLAPKSGPFALQPKLPPMLPGSGIVGLRGGPKVFGLTPDMVRAMKPQTAEDKKLADQRFQMRQDFLRATAQDEIAEKEAAVKRSQERLKEGLDGNEVEKTLRAELLAITKEYQQKRKDFAEKELREREEEQKKREQLFDKDIEKHNRFAKSLQDLREHLRQENEKDREARQKADSMVGTIGGLIPDLSGIARDPQGYLQRFKDAQKAQQFQMEQANRDWIAELNRRAGISTAPEMMAPDTGDRFTIKENVHAAADKFNEEWRNKKQELKKGIARPFDFGADLGANLASEFSFGFAREFEKIFGSGSPITRALARTLDRFLEEFFYENIAKGFKALGELLKGGGGKKKGGGAGQAVAFGLDAILPGIGGVVGGVLGGVLGFQHGGFPPMGRMSIVGEHGPELIRPRGATEVVPLHRLAGAGGPNVSINTPQIVVREEADIGRIGRALANEVFLQMRTRPGR